MCVTVLVEKSSKKEGKDGPHKRSRQILGAFAGEREDLALNQGIFRVAKHKPASAHLKNGETSGCRNMRGRLVPQGGRIEKKGRRRIPSIPYLPGYWGLQEGTLKNYLLRRRDRFSGSL